MTESHDELDAPRPPRHPQRDDEPAADINPGEPAQDPGPEVERVTKRDDSRDIPEPSGDREQQQEAARALQAENAGTTMDQPST